MPTLKTWMKAVLFDADGVLVDTDAALVRSYNATLRHYGLPAKSPREVLRFAGKTDEEWISCLAPELKGKRLKAAVKYAAEHYRKYFLKKYAKLTPGVRRTLRKLKKSGYKLALVTSMHESTALALLRFFRLKKLFDAIVLYESVRRRKPFPEPLLEAVKKLGVRKNEALYVGDTEIDVEAGKRAGIKTLVLDRERNRSIKAKRISSLADVAGVAGIAQMMRQEKNVEK